jgi:membrane protein implicated in regulation of membrane protease activity
MFFIPIWITNVLFLLSSVLSAHQHWRLNRENPITIQFANIIFSGIMILVGVFYTRNHHDPRVSLVFFLIAAVSLFLTIRRFRTLPPKKAFG